MKSACTIEIIAVDENSAVGDVSVVVVNDAVVMPIVSPVVPAPAISTKEADPKPKAKRNSRASEIKAWIGIPARPDSDGRSIDEPRIVFRHVNNLRIGWF